MVRQYEGVAKVRVEGDMAMVQFMNQNWADSDIFRGDGRSHAVEGCMLDVGEIVHPGSEGGKVEVLFRNLKRVNPDNIHVIF